MKRQFIAFIIRVALNSFGLWVAVKLLGQGYDTTGWTDTAYIFIVAGFIFSVINSIIKPVIVILSLPAILLSLGLFMLIINGLMVYWSLQIAPGISMTFMGSILSGIIMSLVNYIVSTVLELKRAK